MLFDFLKTFMERLGCSFMHVDCISIVWDALLTKPVRTMNDKCLLWALCAIIVCLKEKGFMPRRDRISGKLLDGDYCTNLVQLIALVEAKGPLVHEVEFFRTYRRLFTKVDNTVEKDSIVADDPLKYPNFEYDIEETKKIDTENANDVFETFEDTKQEIIRASKEKKTSIENRAARQYEFEKAL